MKDVIAILPTRGLLYSRTISSLKENGIDNPLIIEGLPIPDAHNEAVRVALETYISAILFVEDDMELPPGVIAAMLKVDRAIVACDYPMDNGYSTICRRGEEILWCGLGCTLVNQRVLRSMSSPWFDTSYSWKIESENPLKLTKIDNPYKYGGLDINFCIKAREHGYKIEQVPGYEAKHLRCSLLEKAKGNSGAWDIHPLPPVSLRQHYGESISSR